MKRLKQYVRLIMTISTGNYNYVRAIMTICTGNYHYCVIKC